MIAYDTRSIHHANDQAIVIDDIRGQKYNGACMNKKGLSRIEELAQEMVEGTFSHLFGGRLEPLDVAHRLARAIEDNAYGGQMSLNYHVALNPDDYRFLTGENPHLADSLAAAAQQLGRRAGVSGADKPFIQLEADPELKRRRIRITALSDNISQEADQITQTYGSGNHNEDQLQILEDLDAFLIIQGRRHIPLSRPITTIGRRTENDLVLDLPSVSRQHAQIRWRFGNFILYDISSRGRMLVNGHPAHEQILRPGDVIALGDALLVYGEGNQEVNHKLADVDDGDTIAKPSGKP